MEQIAGDLHDDESVTGDEGGGELLVDHGDPVASVDDGHPDGERLQLHAAHGISRVAGRDR